MSNIIEAPSVEVKERVLGHYINNFKIYESTNTPREPTRYFIMVPKNDKKVSTDTYANPDYAVHSAYSTVRSMMRHLIGKIERER